MFPTVATLQEAVLQELNLVGGSAVQTYTEPQILNTINDCFGFLFDKRFWDHLTNTSEHTLDGVAGVITDEVVQIAKVQDIQWIRAYPYDERDEFYYDPEGTWKDGDRPSFTTFVWDDAQAADKFFNVFPKTTEGQIRIRARRMPTKFANLDDIVPFDEICIKHFVVSTMLAADGMNPSNDARHAALFDQRYQDLISMEGSRILRYGRNTPDSFTVA